MACLDGVRWIVINEDGDMVLGYDDDCELVMIDYLPWAHPFTFARLRTARNVAKKNNGRVIFYNGFSRVNGCKKVK